MTHSTRPLRGLAQGHGERSRTMTERVIISGFGGQGVILMGKVLAEAALKEDKQVTFMPSYGAEVRGGTAHCMVIISDAEIASPIIDKADTLIILNEPSLEKFKQRKNKDAIVIVNSSLVKGVKSDQHTVAGEFSGIATKLGNIKVANMVALGAFLGKKNVVAVESVLKVIEEIAPQSKKDLIQINKQAIQEGTRLV